MSDALELSKIEHLKSGSRQLRGTIAEELLSPDAPFSEGMEQLLKNHGTYQQENRDGRGTGEAKAYGMMVRSRVPGGKVSAAQFLSELDLCDRFGNGISIHKRMNQWRFTLQQMQSLLSLLELALPLSDLFRCRRRR